MNITPTTDSGCRLGSWPIPIRLHCNPHKANGPTPISFNLKTAKAGGFYFLLIDCFISRQVFDKTSFVLIDYPLFP